MAGEEAMNSLCRPRQELSCFRCCPPIRPAGYDHLDHRAQITRLLRENTTALSQNDPQPQPIIGLSCWGLGFLDASERLVGCLLLPAQNRGRDRRGLIGYGQKCAREVCPQAQVFTALPSPVQEAAIALCQGQDSFAFSSPQTNPLWGLLAWGEEVIAASLAGWRSGAGPWFAYLTSHPRPKARAYLLARVFQSFDPSEFGQLDPDRFEAEAEALCRRLGPLSSSPLGAAPYLHRLDLEPGVADVLRFGLGLNRLDPAPALKLQSRLREEAVKLAWRLNPQR